MKSLLIWLLRIALIAAPLYNVYVFASKGEGSAIDVEFLKENFLLIAWAVGAYFLVLLGTFRAYINVLQLILFYLAFAGLCYFYFTPDVYLLFKEVPYFSGEHKDRLSYIPYIFSVFMLLLVMLLKRRYRS